MAEYTYISTDRELTDYLRRLAERGARTVAIDLEGEFNLHVYGERFCLLQVYDGREEVVVDPLTVSIPLIKTFLENRELLKIFYDCTSDRALLYKAHRIELNAILDLRPAVELLGFDRQDLKSVLDSTIGLHEEGSKKRFQQYDWTRRPIDEAAIEYAVQDVRYLFALKDVLLDRLTRSGQLDAFILENLKRQDHLPEVDRKPGIFRSTRHRRLNGAQKREFERMHVIRERYAKELDLPPNTVLSNDNLFSLARGEMAPNELRGNRRVPDDVVRALADEIRRGQ